MAELEAPIKDVTVYSDRALITRRGTLQLEAGEHELRINNLPQFIRDSLRAAGQGPEGTRILNVDVTTAFLQSTTRRGVTQLTKCIGAVTAKSATSPYQAGFS